MQCAPTMSMYFTPLEFVREDSSPPPFSLLWLLPQEHYTNRKAFVYIMYTHIVHKSLRCTCDKIRKNKFSQSLFSLITTFPKFGQRTYLKFWLAPTNQLPSQLARFLQKLYCSFRNFCSLGNMSNGKELHSHSPKGWQFPETQTTSRSPLISKELPEITLHGGLLPEKWFVYFFPLLSWNKIDIWQIETI